MKLALALCLALCYLALVDAQKRPTNCQEEVNARTGTGKWAPQCDEQGMYKKKQCNQEMCWCVTNRKAKAKFGDLKVPLGEDFPCIVPPTKCQRQRFTILVANPEDSTAPECDSAGNFKPIKDEVEPEVVEPEVEEPEVAEPEEEKPIIAEDGKKCDIDSENPTCENMALGRRTFQSSTYKGTALPGRAVDGSDNYEWSGNSCTATEKEANPWWVVDLGVSRTIWRADITNRKDCCADRLNRVHFGVSDSDPITAPPNINNYNKCNFFDGEFGAGETKAFKCMKKGRYFIIQLEQASQYLTLCEVKVFAEKFQDEIKQELAVPEGCRVGGMKCENVAPGKMTYQSSVYDGTAFSGRAIDGDNNSQWAADTCSCTSSETNPWWAVDLVKSRKLYKIAITNRGDCCSERLTNLVIGTSDKSPAERKPSLTNFDACNYYYGVMAPSERREFQCLNKGRFAIIQMEQKNYLTMCEVEVFAESFEEEHAADDVEIPAGCRMDIDKPTCTNVALNRPTFQSSNYNENSVSSRAVDGSDDGNWKADSIACTKLEENPYWAVDLDHKRMVYRIDIVNRADCCAERFRYARIGVSDVSPKEVVPALTNFKVCATSDALLGKGETGRFRCGERGRYVIVQLQHKQYLTMAEVKVYAEELNSDKKDFALPEGCELDKVNPTCGPNMALNKNTYQSSVYGGTTYGGRAVDGVADGLWSSGSCMCTLNEKNAYFAIDLGATRQVWRVDLLNRKDCCADRLRWFVIGTTDENPMEKKPVIGNYDICARSNDLIGAGEMKAFGCGTTGRYVIIQLLYANYLTICEAKVYAETLPEEKAALKAIPAGCEVGAANPTCPNVAQGKLTGQSSIYKGYYKSALAVDGNTDGNWAGKSCACTNDEKNPYWYVDLGEERLVYWVSITNRKDCCNDRLNNIHLGVTNKDPLEVKPDVEKDNFEVCATSYAPIGAGVSQPLKCMAKGRYVIIQLQRSEYLTLCEVKVYAE